jgi:tRNA A37 methylthiotransferase MiaB
VRSNVIVGFPGETEEDVAVLADFLAAARLDAVGVFGYSDEEGTEGATLDGKLTDDVIAERVDRLAGLCDEVSAQRAEDRLGERVRVLVEGAGDDGRALGRATHQGPETDGSTTVERSGDSLSPGVMVWGNVTATDGVDLVVELEGQ